MWSMIETWTESPAPYRARAKHRIYDTDGSFAKRGSIGTVEDILDGYVMVDFPETGPILCDPKEITPA